MDVTNLMSDEQSNFRHFPRESPQRVPSPVSTQHFGTHHWPWYLGSAQPWEEKQLS